jgi:hypothetical protein
MIPFGNQQKNSTFLWTTNPEAAGKPRGHFAFFWEGVSNSNSAVRLYREGRATGPPEDRYRTKEKS